MSVPEKRGVTFSVNGREATVWVADRTSLVEALREELGLTGTHVGCEHGACGACTVLVDGRPVRGCLLFAIQMEGAAITTIEGLRRPGDGLHPVQEAFRECAALQCGFCTPGMVLTVAALLEERPDPDEAEVREAISGNLCMCTGYQNIVRAALRASQLLRVAR